MMELTLETHPWSQAEADWLIVGHAEGAPLSGPLAELDSALGGALARLQAAGDLTGKPLELVPLYGPVGLSAERLLIVGLGKEADLHLARWSAAVRTAARHISTRASVRAAIGIPALPSQRIAPAALVQAAATAMTVGCTGQALYRREQARYPFERVRILAGDARLAPSAERGRTIGVAANLARELVNRAPHEIHPASFAKRAQDVAGECGLGCEVLDQAALERERMGAMLAVARGSAREPRMVLLEHRRGGEGAPTLALCGKGVTFDSGGLSLKTNEGMLTMKGDMAGGATVLAAMSAIARLDLRLNVLGLIGLVENMPSGTSYKLGDVLTARNGTTIEVHNTDAEGRLVLADVLSYAVDRGASRIVDLATLTGACVVALGEDVTGVFSNQQEWCNQLLAAAGACGEDVWQMPLFEHFAEQIKSDVADIKNVGSRWGGAITAAKFLECFVSGKPWIHLDIAGPAFASANKPQQEGGASGCMVATLVELATALAEPR